MAWVSLFEFLDESYAQTKSHGLSASEDLVILAWIVLTQYQHPTHRHFNDS